MAANILLCFSLVPFKSCRHYKPLATLNLITLEFALKSIRVDRADANAVRIRFDSDFAWFLV